MPLLRNNCIMNLLAYYVEDVEFDNKWKKNIDNFDYTLLLSKYFTPSDTKLLKHVSQCLSDAFKSYARKINMIRADDITYYNAEEIDVVEQKIYQDVESKLKNDLYSYTNNEEDIANYVIYCYYNYFSTKSRYWMWDICGNAIINNLRNKASAIFIPEESEDGVEYLGRKYILKRVECLNDSD